MELAVMIYENDLHERMLNYYPEVLKTIREFQALIRCEAVKLQTIHNNIDAIQRNVYITTADNTTLTEWEKLLEITPLPQGATQTDEEWLEDRRETIMARLFHPEKLNSQSIADTVNIFTSGETISYFKNGTIYVSILPPENNKSYQFDNVKQELAKKVPAHLRLEVEVAYRTWEEIENTYETWEDMQNITWQEVQVKTKD